jgi:AcrR family transcriptional regulator
MPEQEPNRTKRPAASQKTRSSREKTTLRILDAAEELFASRNPLSVTVRDVAEKAGVTHALVHQYIGTKDDLLNAVLQRVATDRTAIVKESTSLREAYAVLVHQILTNRVHSKALVRSAMDGVEYVSLRQRIKTGEALIELEKQTAVSGTSPAPPPRGIDPRVVLAAISSMAFGWSATEDWAWQVYGLDPADKEDVYRQLGDIAFYIADLVLQPTEDETAK